MGDDPEIIPVSARDMEAIEQSLADPGEPNEALMRSAERCERLIDAAKPDLDAMFDASWEQNEAGYRHLAGQSSSGEDGAAETFEFCVRLAGNPDLTTDMLNALFEAGCDDATPCRVDGATYLDFARVGTDLGAAIRLAMHDVRKAGYDPIFPKPKREAGERS